MSTKPSPLIQFFGRFFHHTAFAAPTEVERAELLFYLNYLREGMVVLDVGAYVGEMAVLFSKLVGKEGVVHAFEATRSGFEKLNTVCELMPRKNIVANHMAVTDKEGIAKINVYDCDHLSWSTMAARPLGDYGIPVRPVRSEDVLTTTVDAYCEQSVIPRVDLLKIDVEGAEYQVLLGAQRMLKDKKITCCVFEYGQTTFDMGNHPREIRTYLDSVDYRISNVVAGDPAFPGKPTAHTALYSMCVAKPKP